MGMVHSLYETTDCWKRTTIKHVQLIVKEDFEVLTRKIDLEQYHFTSLFDAGRS